jgi:predicted GIY-YIG superfamily endonuclease
MKIYVLKLENNKYYIGKTTDINKRLQQHFSEEFKASVWTSKYKPVDLIRTIDNVDEFDEDKWVKIYMKKHGVDNVRGGSYSNLEIHFTIRHFIENELNHAEEKCFICLKYGHLSMDCVKNKNKNKRNYKKTVICNNCGLKGHSTNKCFYKTEYEKACNLCGKDGHYNHECNKRFS